MYAQFPQGMPASMKNAGHIYGKITDGDGKPVEGASVLILHRKYGYRFKENEDDISKRNDHQKQW